MKYVIFMLVVCTAAFAYDMDAGVGGPSIQMGDQAADGKAIITLTPLNTFQLNYGTTVRCLDAADGYDELLYTCYTDNKWYAVRPSDGSLVYDHDVVDTCADPIGIAFIELAYNEFYFNDWDWALTTSLWMWEVGGDWTEYPNPCGGYGRGMDYDIASGYIWQAFIDPYAIYRHLPDGSDVTSWNISEPGGNLCGLAVFPYNSNLGVMVTCYADPSIYVYEYTGSSLDYLGSAPCPWSASSSYGLTWDADRGTFFWSYAPTSSVFYAGEFTMVIDLGLEPATWGSIKTSF